LCFTIRRCSFTNASIRLRRAQPTHRSKAAGASAGSRLKMVRSPSYNR
jgi:hypothetical protein